MKACSKCTRQPCAEAHICDVCRHRKALAYCGDSTVAKPASEVIVGNAIVIPRSDVSARHEHLATPLDFPSRSAVIIASRKSASSSASERKQLPAKVHAALRETQEFLSSFTPPTPPKRLVMPGDLAHPEDVEQTRAWHPSIDKLAQNLVNRMGMYYSGASYAFVVQAKSSNAYFNGPGPFVPYEYGYARRAAPSYKLRISNPINIASVSKVITCAAVLHAIWKSNGAIHLDKPIHLYFPKQWVPNGGVKLISIRNCLQYKNGILNNGEGGIVDLYALRSWYELGGFGSSWVFSPSIGIKAAYNNVSHAWFRIMLFYMTASKPLQDAYSLIYDSDYAFWHTLVCMYYRNYVKTKLLWWANWVDLNPISEYDATPPDIQAKYQTLYYTYPNYSDHSGIPSKDWLKITGGGGWIMSAKDLSDFWFALRYLNIIPKWYSDLIINFDHPDECLSLESPLADSYGPILYKGGFLKPETGPVRTLVVALKQGINVTLVSNHGISESLIKEVKWSYDNCWTY